jgi:hypothetical protein
VATVYSPHLGSSDPSPADITQYIQVQGIRKFEREIGNRDFATYYQVQLRIAPGAQGSLTGVLANVWTLYIPAAWRGSRRFVSRIQDEMASSEHSQQVNTLKSRVTNAGITWDENTVMKMVAELVARAINDSTEPTRAESSRNRPPRHRSQRRSPSPSGVQKFISFFGSGR